MNKRTFTLAVIVMVFMNIFSLINIFVKAHEEDTNNESAKLEIEQELEKVFMIDDDQLLIQQKIELKSKTAETINNINELYINVPEISQEIPENINILENGKCLEKDKYTYNVEDKKIIVNSNNESTIYGGGHINKKYQVIYEYNNIDIDKEENKLPKELKLGINVKVNINDKKNIIENNITVPLELKGEKISIREIEKQQIYKGYMEQGRETIYQQNYNVEISSNKDVNEIIIENINTNFITEEEEILANDFIYFRNTILNKREIFNILGDNGKLTIKDENDNIIQEITKETQAKENGEIEINYDNVRNIKIILTKPEKIGSLKIKNQKVISNNIELNLEKIYNTQYLKEEIKVNGNQFELENELLEPQTEFDFSMNKQNLSTVNNNDDVEMRITLKANKPEQKLFENPIIKITFPEQVQKIELKDNINILYTDELSIKNIEIEGRNIILELNGTQTKYQEEAIEGIDILIKANIILNKKAVTQKVPINIVCENKGETNTIQKEVEIISPREIITSNEISEYGIETIGDKEIEQLDLERNGKTKNIKIQSEIINNDENEIKDINILGDMPTNGKILLDEQIKENNLGVKVTSNIEVEGKDTQIYYTEKKFANEDIDNLENGWTTEITDINKISKYLIKIDSLEHAQGIKLAYNIEIPENLEFNQKAYQGYKVTYNTENNQTKNIARATYVELTTGQGPNLELEAIATVGENILDNNSKVNAGEKINYKVTIKNTGETDANNVEVIGKIPENTVYYSNTQNQEYDEQNKQVKIKIDNIKPGESKQVEYLVKTDSNIEEETKITGKIGLICGEIEKEINTVTCTVIPSEITVNLYALTNENSILIPGNIVGFQLEIENNTNTPKNDLQLEWNFSDIHKINMQYTINEEENIMDEVLPNEKKITLPEIKENSKLSIKLSLEIGKFEGTTTELSLMAKIKDKERLYYSETVKNFVYGNMNYDIKLSANNEGGYVKSGDNITYKIEIKNNNVLGYGIYIDDEIPKELTIQEIYVNGEKREVEDENAVSIDATLEAGQTIVIEIKTIVDYLEGQSEDIQIKNQAELTILNGEGILSNEVTHIIEKTNIFSPDENPTDNRYKISGNVWNDLNKDGILESSESGIEGVKIRAIDINNNKAAEQNGKEIIATSDANGFYILDGLKQGTYIIVFEYDSSQYYITTYKKQGIADNVTSKATSKELNINGKKGIYGVTDKIEINDLSIANINMGLIQAQKFDLKLDKYIEKVTVESNKSLKTYGYNNSQLAKVELHSKKEKNAKITVEYKIVISNIGEIDGYAKSIIDYIPEGWNLEEANGWNLQNGILTSEQLANEKIKVGEQKELTVKLVKNVNNDNWAGSYINTAEIGASYNELGISDINSVENNKKPGENDISSATVILSISTGKTITVITILLSSIFILGIGIILIKKKILNKK